MSRSRRHTFRNNRHAIVAMWWHWVLGTGLCMVPVMLTVALPQVWLPFVTLALAALLRVHIRAMHRHHDGLPHTDVLTICSSALVLSALVMLAINCMHLSWLEALLLNPARFNHHIRFLSVLIVAPCMLACGIYYRHATSQPGYALRHASTGFLGHVTDRENRMQIQLITMLSGALTLLAWPYYFIFYINTNLNSPDMLVFVWLPGILCAVAALAMAMRYIGLFQFYHREVAANTDRYAGSTLLRVLRLSHDRLLLKAMAGPDGVERLDTPLQFYVDRCTEASPATVAAVIASHTGRRPDPSGLRFLYGGNALHSDCNVLHWVEFADSATSSEAEGEWYTLHAIISAAREHHVAPELSKELMRVYRVVMAWKTYDRSGRRLYPIKNYRPIFHLCDLPRWDVDFDDPVWLRVAAFNQDCRLFSLRHALHRLVWGREKGGGSDE